MAYDRAIEVLASWKDKPVASKDAEAIQEFLHEVYGKEKSEILADLNRAIKEKNKRARA